jgi:hypothetical protein
MSSSLYFIKKATHPVGFKAYESWILRLNKTPYKFIRFLFAEIENCYKFATDFVPWCNGNTPVFGIVILGSSPSGTTEKSP